jgi:hypothetical protein
VTDVLEHASGHIAIPRPIEEEGEYTLSDNST